MDRRAQFRDQARSVFDDADAAAGNPPAPGSGGTGFRILTVCTGNICRSPLMEAVLRRELAGLRERDAEVEVASRGLHAVVGAPADPTMQRVAAELGYDLSGHVARQFEAADARGAGLILTATRAQRDSVVAQAPAAVKRCFTWKEFAALAGGLTAGGVDEFKRAVAAADQRRQELAQTEDLDIEDPYGGGACMHIAVARTLMQIGH